MPHQQEGDPDGRHRGAVDRRGEVGVARRPPSRRSRAARSGTAGTRSPCNSRRFRNSSRRSTLAIRSNIEWWLTHMMPITTNESTNATYDGQWSTSASRRLPCFAWGTVISRTSSVIAIAITPSLNASSRRVVELGACADGGPPGDQAPPRPGPGFLGHRVSLPVPRRPRTAGRRPRRRRRRHAPTDPSDLRSHASVPAHRSEEAHLELGRHDPLAEREDGLLGARSHGAALHSVGPVEHPRWRGTSTTPGATTREPSIADTDPERGSALVREGTCDRGLTDTKTSSGQGRDERAERDRGGRVGAGDEKVVSANVSVRPTFSSRRPTCTPRLRGSARSRAH